jgi:hypothetical protein
MIQTAPGDQDQRRAGNLFLPNLGFDLFRSPVHGIL